MDELDEEFSQNRAMIMESNNAALLGFDVPSLAMVSVLAKKHGGPYKVAEAIRKYESIKELDQELGAKKADLEAVKRENSEKTSYLHTLKYSLNEAKEVYEKSGEVRLVVELLDNPRGIQMNRSEVVWLLSRVLACSIERIDENSGILDLPDPDWSAVYESIKSLAVRLLHQFSKI